MWRQFILFTQSFEKKMEKVSATIEIESSVIEFDVNMTCGSCEDSIRSTLSKITGVTSLEVNVAKQQVVVMTTQPSAVIQKAIESTGMLAVLKGQGLQAGNHIGAAISILKHNKNTLGLVRFTQTTEDSCIVDGSFNGLAPGKYGLHIHEFGDLSEGSDSTGNIFDPRNSCHGDRLSSTRKVGDLGNVEVDGEGSSVFRYQDNLIKVWDIIGRSLVIHEKEDDFSTDDPHGNAGKGLAYGIIARSAGLFQNKKMVCSCSGKTIWQERQDVKDGEMG